MPRRIIQSCQPSQAREHVTRGQWSRGTFLLLAVLLVGGPARCGAAPCTDCNGDSGLSIGEQLLASVAIALTVIPATPCFDINHNNVVTIDEVIAAVNRAVNGCPQPTPTPTRTATNSATPTDTPTMTVPPTSTETPASFWQSLASLPEARQDVGVAELGGRIYVIGGLVQGPDDSPQIVDTVEYYDPLLDTWSTAAPLPATLCGVVAAAVNGQVYAIGGLGSLDLDAVDSLYAYDPDTDTWASRANLPMPRGAGGAAVLDGHIYVAGGLRADTSVNDFAVYDPVSDTWNTLTPMPTARDHLGAGTINGIFYAVGGERRDELFGLLEAYDPTSATWRQDLHPMPTARSGVAVAVLANRLFAMGGEGNLNSPTGVFAQTEVYVPDQDAWQDFPDMTTPRHATAAAALGDRVFVPGGAVLGGFAPSAVNEALRP